MASSMNDPATPPAIWHGTTILTVRKLGKVVIAGDGQVSLGATVIKANARKVRSVGKGDVIGGFAGATADAFTLFERLEAKLEQYPGQLTRACVELAKDWRTDRYLRRLEAMMIVADRQRTLTLTGTGDVLEPEGGVMGIGSGGNFALAAAKALFDTPLGAEEIARRAMAIAAEICIYTNSNIVVESLESALRGCRPVPTIFAPCRRPISPWLGAGWRPRTLWRGGASPTRSSRSSAATSRKRASSSTSWRSPVARSAICSAMTLQPGRRADLAASRRARAASISSSASRT